jgi:drug/metabolite transporter (DMT)-like permease
VALLFGIIAAVLLGGSDVCAARSSRSIASVTVTRTALATSSVIALGLLFTVSSHFIARDSVLAVASGLALCIGLFLLYRAYSIAPIGIVAPTTSVLLALVPVLYDVFRGIRPSALGAVGMGLGLLGVVAATYVPGGQGSARVGVILGIAAGVGFGIGFTFMAHTSKASGLSPVLIQRAVGFAVLALATPFDRSPLVATRRPARLPAIAAGVLAGGAIASLQLGYRHGSAGTVSVAASQFATTAVALSVIFNKERLRPLQATGIAVAAVGVGLMALS